MWFTLAEQVGEMLYLLKSSRVQEYHQQNVAIIGSSESDRFEISYTDRWIEPGLKVSVGDGCVIVLSDSPYEYFVPVRFGVIEQVDHRDGGLRLQVRVTAPVRSGGTEKVNQLFSAFDRDDPDRPGRRFLFEADNPDLESPQSDADRDQAWIEIVDRLERNGYFENTTFTRLRRLMTPDGRPLDPSGSVAVGQELVAVIETRAHRDELQGRSLYVESDPQGAIDCDDIGEIAGSGLVELLFRVTSPGPVQVTVRTLPEPLKSSRSVFGLLAEAVPESHSSAATEPVVELKSDPISGHIIIRSRDLTTLMKYLDRKANLDADAWVGLCEVLLRDFDADAPAVLSKMASCNFELGRFDECVRALKGIENLRPAEEFLLVLAALRGEVEIDFEKHASRMDIEKDSDFDRLVEAITTTDRVVLERVTKVLFRDILGDNRKIQLVERVFGKIGTIELAVDLADSVAHVDPLVGTQLLLDRWTPDVAPTKAVDLLLDWRDGGNRLAPYFEKRASQLAGADKFDELQDLCDLARRVLTGDEWTRVCRSTGELLLDSGSKDHSDVGFDLLLESINSELTAGEFDTAAALAKGLLGEAVVSGDKSRTTAAQAIFELALESIFTSSGYLDWVSFTTDTTVKRLQPHVAGKAIHVVGGKQGPWIDEIHEELGLSDARWHLTEKRKGIDHDWVDHLDPDRDVVIVITYFIGHAISGPIKEKCDRKGIIRLEARPTKQSVLEVLERQFVPEAW